MSLLDHFARPEFAPLLLIAPAAGLVLAAVDRLRRRRVRQALGPRQALLIPGFSRVRRRTGRFLFLGAIALMALAAMQPRWGQGAGTIAPRGVDIVLCLDVSRSMLARDVSPSRLERAKREIRALAGRAEGDRLGLVVFAGEARLLVPLTKDRRSFVELSEQAEPLIIPRGGTDLGAALLTSLQAFSGRSGAAQAIVLLSDGDDLEGRGLSVAKTCKERGISVHTVGFGSARGAKIPVLTDGRETFITDSAGNEVVSALDETGLRRIAELTGGTFSLVSEAEQTLPALHEDHLRPLARRTFLAAEREERENRFQWPLFLALALLLTDLVLCAKRS